MHVKLMKQVPDTQIELDGPKNLYVRDLDKDLTETDVRQKFARFGKVKSLKLVSHIQFATNIAFIAFFNSSHAK